jgi:hypothetical protein
MVSEDLDGDRLASKSLHEDLHPATNSENKMKRRVLLNVVVGESSTVFELFSCEDEELLVRGNASRQE